MWFLFQFSKIRLNSIKFVTTGSDRRIQVIHVYLLFYDGNYPNNVLYHTCHDSSKNWYFCPSVCIYTQRLELVSLFQI